MSENPFGVQLVDMVASTSSLTDDFTDDEAIPIIDWASIQAERVGQTIASEETYAEVAEVFAKWIRTVVSIIARRNVADAAWLHKMVTRLNEFAPILRTDMIRPEEEAALLNNGGMDTASFRQLFLPMLEPDAGNESPSMLDAVQDTFQQIADVISGDLTDVSHATSDNAPPMPQVLPSPPDNPLANYRGLPSDQIDHVPTESDIDQDDES